MNQAIKRNHDAAMASAFASGKTGAAKATKVARAAALHVEPGGEPCGRCTGVLACVRRFPDRVISAGGVGDGRRRVVRVEDFACTGCGRELRRQRPMSLGEAKR